MTVALHDLGELVDVKDIAAKVEVIGVDVLAGESLIRVVVAVMEQQLLAVLQQEHVLVCVGGKETDIILIAALQGVVVKT